MLAWKHAAIYAIAALVLGGVFTLYAHPDFVAVAGDVMWSCMGMGHDTAAGAGSAAGHAHH